MRNISSKLVSRCVSVIVLIAEGVACPKEWQHILDACYRHTTRVSPSSNLQDVVRGRSESVSFAKAYWVLQNLMSQISKADEDNLP